MKNLHHMPNPDFMADLNTVFEYSFQNVNISIPQYKDFFILFLLISLIIEIII